MELEKTLFRLHERMLSSSFMYYFLKVLVPLLLAASKNLLFPKKK